MVDKNRLLTLAKNANALNKTFMQFGEGWNKAMMQRTEARISTEWIASFNVKLQTDLNLDADVKDELQEDDELFWDRIGEYSEQTIGELKSSTGFSWVQTGRTGGHYVVSISEISTGNFYPDFTATPDLNVDELVTELYDKYNNDQESLKDIEKELNDFIKKLKEVNDKLDKAEKLIKSAVAGVGEWLNETVKLHM